MATTYLSKTLSTATSNGIIGTFSFWVKLCGIRTDGNDYMLFSSYADGNNRMHIKIAQDGTFFLLPLVGCRRTTSPTKRSSVEGVDS